ncbi:MAG: chorismate mutase [Bacteroidia bacterium]
MNEFDNKLEEYRNQLLHIDKKIIDLLNQRALIAKEIGVFKFKNNIEIYQTDYWQKAQLIRSKTVETTILNDNITTQIFELIHQQSLLIQEEILKQKNEQ